MPPLDELDQSVSETEEVTVDVPQEGTDEEIVDIPPVEVETPAAEVTVQPEADATPVEETPAPTEETPEPYPTPEDTMPALTDVESKGKGAAVSSKGAMGRTQVMPRMWKAYSNKPFDPEDTEEQDRVGLAILSDEYVRFKHNMPLALAAYNAGSPAVIRAMKSAGYDLKQAGSVNFDDIKQYLPAETQKYVPNVLGKINTKKKSADQAKVEGPITAGTKEEADAAITEVISQPDFNTIGAPAASKKIKEIYDSKPYWTKEAQDTFKRVSTTVWKSALSNEKPNLGEMIGAPPRLTKEDKDPDKTLAAWKAQTTAELEQMGIDPLLYGDEYDQYFKDAGTSEKAALEYRERSALGQGYNWVTGATKAVVSGAISNVTGAAAAIPRMLGAEETADYIESGATIFGTPTPDFFYEVNENGDVKFDEYGKPITKFQGTIASAVGQGIGLLAGGAGLRLAGAGARTITTVMGGTNVLNTGNEAYKDAIDNGGTPSQARTAALLSIPSAAVDTLGDMYVVSGGKAWVKGMSKFDKARFIAKEAGKSAAVEGSTEAIQQEMQDLGTSQAIGQDITSGKRVLEAGIGGAAAGAVVGAATAPFKRGPATPGQLAAGATNPRPSRDEHIRIAQELTKFKESPDMSTVLTIRSKEDIDPELFEMMGMRATLLPGNKIKVDKKVSYTAPEVDTADDMAVNSQMKTTAETLSKEPPADIEYANELAKDQEMLNSRWKTIPESVKKDIPFIQELIDKHKKLNEEIRQIIAVEGEAPVNPTLGSDLRNLQKEAAVIGQYLTNNEDVAVAASILNKIKSNQNKLDNMVRAEYPHELTEQENRLRQLVAASKALVSEATGETATPDEKALQGEIQKLVDESLALQQQTSLYEKPRDEAEAANFEEHIIASIRDNKKWGNYDTARMMQKRLDDFRAQQALYKADPELAAKLKEQFKRIEAIRDEVTKLRAKAGKALTREQSHIVDVYGSPMPSETDIGVTQPARNGIPIKTSTGVKLVIPVQNSWYVGDASGNITGGKHKYFYEAAKEIYSQDVMSKPPLPIWSSFHANQPMRVVDANFTPPENIARTSKTLISPRDIYKAGKKILKTIHKFAKNPVSYNMREGGREERGLVNKVLGYASHRQRYIYLKYSNDPTTLVHEVAHAVSNDLLDLAGLPNEVKIGLVNQAATFYGDPNLPNFSLERILSEGFSNFLEHYSSGQPVDMRVLDFYNTTFKTTLPNVYDAIEDVKNLTKSYIAMDPFTRAKMFTSASKERKQKKPGFVENYIDAQRVFYEFDRQAGTNLKDLSEYIKGQGKAKAQEMASGEYFSDFESNRVAGALTRDQIVAPVKKRLDDVVAYMVAKYTMARKRMQQTTGFPINDAKDIIEMAEITHRADFEPVVTAANRLWHWQEDVLDVAASRSPLFAEIINKIRAHNVKVTGVAHGFYIPFSREFETITDLPLGRAKTEGGQNPFMRFTGSTKRIANPLLIMEDRARGILTAANKNYILNQALAVADAGALPVTEYIRELPKHSVPSYKTSVQNILESMQKQIDPEFSNVLNALDEDTLAKLVTLYAPEKNPPTAADGFVTVAYRQAGGKLGFYEVSPEFIRAFDDSMPDLVNNPIFRWMWVMPNVVFKLGATTFRMSYQLRNLLFRDFMTGYFRTKSNNPIAFAKDIITALAQEFAVSSGISKAFGFRVPWVEFSKRHGMQTATLYHAGRDFEQDIERASGMKVVNFLNKPLNYMEDVLSSGERATRLVAAKYKARELGLTDPDQPTTPEQDIEITLAYKRSTTNFQVQGRQARFINLGVPFFTARIAEVSQMERDWKERRPRMMKFALAYLTLGLYQALANKDDKWWQNLEPEERGTNFLTTVGDKIVRIPLSSLGGLFNSFGNLIGDSIIQQNLLKPSLAEHVYAMAKNYSPITHIMDLAGVVGKEAAQQALNKDFFTERNIVPRGLEEAPTASQYTSATTELAKELGRIIGYPPAKIDHALRGMFPAGLDVLKQWENITGIKPITDQSKSLAGVFASAVTRSGFVSSSMDRSTEKFYNMAAKYRANKDIETPAEGNIRKALNKLQDQLSSINVVLSAEPDQETRKDLYEKKAKILEQGLKITAGETAPVVRKISEESKAKNLRALQQRERAQRQRQRAKKELSLE